LKEKAAKQPPPSSPPVKHRLHRVCVRNPARDQQLPLRKPARGINARHRGLAPITRRASLAITLADRIGVRTHIPESFQSRTEVDADKINARGVRHLESPFNKGD
jgi:hypothetical protein